MKNLSIITIIFIFIGTACNPCVRLYKKCPPVIRDSISYIITLDTLIMVSPADTLYIEIPRQPTLQDLIVDSPGPKLSIRVKEKVIAIQIICPEDSLKAVITELETREVKTIEVKVNVPVRYTPKFWKYAALYALCLTILIVVWLYLKFKTTALNRLKMLTGKLNL